MRGASCAAILAPDSATQSFLCLMVTQYNTTPVCQSARYLLHVTTNHSKNVNQDMKPMGFTAQSASLGGAQEARSGCPKVSGYAVWLLHISDGLDIYHTINLSRRS